MLAVELPIAVTTEPFDVAFGFTSSTPARSELSVISIDSFRPRTVAFPAASFIDNEKICPRPVDVTDPAEEARVSAVGVPAVVTVYETDLLPAAKPVVVLPPTATKIVYVPATSGLIESVQLYQLLLHLLMQPHLLLMQR